MNIGGNTNKQKSLTFGPQVFVVTFQIPVGQITSVFTSARKTHGRQLRLDGIESHYCKAPELIIQQLSDIVPKVLEDLEE